jgi:hypothetical protein
MRAALVIVVLPARYCAVTGKVAISDRPFREFSGRAGRGF